MRYTALVFLLLILGTGCADPLEATATKIEVGEHSLTYVPPKGWQSEGDQWIQEGEGRLSVTVVGQDPRKVCSDRLVYALGLMKARPKVAAKVLASFPPRGAHFEYDPQSKELDTLVRRVRQSGTRIALDPARARKEIEQVLADFREFEVGDDPEARAKHYIDCQGVRGGRRRIIWVSATTAGPAKSPAFVSATRDSYGSAKTSLFLVHEGHLVVFEVSHGSSKGPLAIERLMAVGESIRLQHLPPHKAPAPPRRQPLVASSGAWEAWLEPVVFPALFMLFIVLPTWVGTGFGYDRARAAAGNVRTGAAGMAFMASSCGVMAGSILTAGVLKLALYGEREGSGILATGMDPSRLSALLFALGASAGVGAGALAAGGAYLGAATDRDWAQVMATVVAALGVLLGPVLLKAFGAVPSPEFRPEVRRPALVARAQARPAGTLGKLEPVAHRPRI